MLKPINAPSGAGIQETISPVEGEPPSPSWRDMVQVHPVAKAYPMISDTELDALSKDIKERGLQYGLTFWTPADWSGREARSEARACLIGPSEKSSTRT
jgi:hypothetical protein